MQRRNGFIIAPKGPIVKRPRQTMRSLLKNVRASVSVCVSVTQMMSTIIHPSPIIRHPAAHHLHLTQHPRQKVRRVNNVVLPVGIANIIVHEQRAYYER